MPGDPPLPIPVTWVIYGFSVFILMVWAAFIGWLLTTFPGRVRVCGTSMVGKSTFQANVRKPSTFIGTLPRTMDVGYAINVPWQLDPKDKKTRHTINLRDIPGDAHTTGIMFDVLVKDQPSVVIFMVDERVLEPADPDIDASHDQEYAFRTLISILLSDRYKNRVLEKNRAQYVILGVNKFDRWSNPDDTPERRKEEAKRIAKRLHRHIEVLQEADIETDVVALRANDRDFVKPLMDHVVRWMAERRRPWHDLWMYWRLGLSDEARRLSKMVERASPK